QPQKKAVRRCRTASLRLSLLLVVDRPTLELIAAAPAGILPIHLDQPIVAAQGLVVPAAADAAGGGSEFPRALVGIFIATAVIPRVEIGIRNSLLTLVRHDGRHAIRAAVTVRADSLGFARVRTTIRVADK